MTDIIETLNIPTTNNVVADIKSILAEARRVTARAVNTTMVYAYWLIGRRIVVEEQNGKDRAEYGEYLRDFHI